MAFALALLLAAAAAPQGHETWQRDYPSCDLPAQRGLVARTSGQVRDPRLAHILMRVNVLQADIGNARIARHLPQRDSQRLWNQAAAIMRDANHLTRQQGFLSAGERASYDRALDTIATRLCRG